MHYQLKSLALALAAAGTVLPAVLAGSTPNPDDEGPSKQYPVHYPLALSRTESRPGLLPPQELLSAPLLQRSKSGSRGTRYRFTKGSTPEIEEFPIAEIHRGQMGRASTRQTVVHHLTRTPYRELNLGLPKWSPLIFDWKFRRGGLNRMSKTDAIHGLVPMRRQITDPKTGEKKWEYDEKRLNAMNHPHDVRTTMMYKGKESDKDVEVYNNEYVPRPNAVSPEMKAQGWEHVPHDDADAPDDIRKAASELHARRQHVKGASRF